MHPGLREPLSEGLKEAYCPSQRLPSKAQKPKTAKISEAAWVKNDISPDCGLVHSEANSGVTCLDENHP
jgi:hypothetical protein